MASPEGICVQSRRAPFGFRGAVVECGAGCVQEAAPTSSGPRRRREPRHIPIGVAVAQLTSDLCSGIEKSLPHRTTGFQPGGRII